MRPTIRSAAAVMLALLLTIAGSGQARAALTGATGTNVQDGDNRDTTNQSGSGKSGASVGGQVSGVVSSG
jgi:hypothetical protein